MSTDGSDLVACLDAGALCRGAGDDAHDRQGAVRVGDQDADAGDLAAQLAGHLLILLGRQEPGVVRVAQAVDQAADRAVEELLVR